MKFLAQHLLLTVALCKACCSMKCMNQCRKEKQDSLEYHNTKRTALQLPPPPLFPPFSCPPSPPLLPHPHHPLVPVCLSSSLSTCACLSFFQSVNLCLFVFLPVCQLVPVCLSSSLSTCACLSFFQSVNLCLFVFLPVCQLVPVCLSSSLSTCACLSFFQSINLCLFVFLPVYQLVPVCLSSSLSTCACLSFFQSVNLCLFVFLPPSRWPSGKASASRAEDPGFESRWSRDFFGVESYQWLKNWHSSGYPARCLAL